MDVEKREISDLEDVTGPLNLILYMKTATSRRFAGKMQITNRYTGI